MPDIKLRYGESNQPLAITLAALANNGVRSSLSVNNADPAAQFIEVHGHLNVTLAASGVSASGAIRLYIAASYDNGTTWTAGNGTDAAVSNLNGLVPLEARRAVINGQQILIPFSVGRAFNGIVPPLWALIVENSSGAALASGSAHYQGIWGST